MSLFSTTYYTYYTYNPIPNKSKSKLDWSAPKVSKMPWYLAFISSILILLTLSSCEEAFTPEVQHQPVLCINSLVTAGEKMSVAVSKSRLYTDPVDKTKVDDSTVEIYANGQIQSEDYVPQQGDKIEIRARSPTVGEAKAEVVIPKEIPFTNAKWEPYDVILLEKEGKRVLLQFKLHLNLTINDPTDDNYYLFTYEPMYMKEKPWEGSEDDDPIYGVSHRPYYLTIANLQYDLEPIFSEHIGAFESVMGGEPDGFNFFTDRQFSGESYTLNLHFQNCMFLGALDEMPDCRYGFDLNTISLSYYNWMRYVWEVNDGTLTDMGELGFSDSIWGYSNVSTGAGVVAAQTQSTLVIDFKEYLTKVLQEVDELFD